MEFDETLRFWYPRVAWDVWINFSSHFNEYQLLDFHRSYREVKFFFSFLSLSPLTLCLSPLLSIPFDFPFSFYPCFSFSFFLFFLTWIQGSHCAMCSSLIQVHFYSITIYFFVIKFILNELSSSHFLTSEFFVKISSIESLTTYHPENRKNILIFSEFDETFLDH